MELSAVLTPAPEGGYVAFNPETGTTTQGETIEEALDGQSDRPVALVLGAEGPGLREKTRETCDSLVKIAFAGDFGSLNVSNAAAVALYASQEK